MSPLRWFKNIAISVDILANALLFGRRVETISSRAARAKDKGEPWGDALCDVLDNIDDDHCENSRAQDHNAPR
jgi:hypothetical protein